MIGMDRELPSKDKPGPSFITAQLEDLPLSKSQILIYPSLSMCFQYMCTSMCAGLLSPDKSNGVIYTEGKVWYSALWEPVYSHANIISIADDRVLGGKESFAARHKCQCFIPGIPLCTADGWWRPEHRKGPAIQANSKILFQLIAGLRSWKRTL